MKKPAAEEPFVLTAMLSLVGATAWLVIRPRLLLQFFYAHETLALTHLITLGFASSIILGIHLRLGAEALRAPPRSTRISWIQVAVWITGVGGMVFHFCYYETRAAGLAWATLVVLAAILLYVWNISALFRRALDPDWSARWVAAGFVHLVLAALLGASYGCLRVWGVGASFLTAPVIDRLSAHLHIAALGWIGSTIFGYQLRMLPATRASSRLEAIRFVLHQFGVLGLATCLLTGAPGVTVCALSIATSIALRSVPALYHVRGNKLALWESLAHLVLLLLAATGVLLACGIPEPDSDLRQRVDLAYGFVAFFGWVALTVMGTSWKLFSKWVWHERFQPDKGKKPIPAAWQLPSPLLRNIGGCGLLFGSLGGATAIVLDHAPALRVALGVLLVGVAGFVANFIRIARWELLPLEYKPPGK